MTDHPISRAGAPAILCAALVAALALPSTAAATLIEIGARARTTAPATPSCPGSPCLAVSRTTGFQVRVGSMTAPIIVPTAGRIVAWTITLSRPNATQISYFNSHEGGAPSAAIAILRPKKAPKPAPKKSKGKGKSKPGKKKKKKKKAGLERPGLARGAATRAAKHSSKTKSKPKPPGPALRGYTLVAQSPVVQLEAYLGQTVEFALEKTIEVQKGEVIALTVPTWAPALTLGFGKETTWRASRPQSKKGCEETSIQTAQTKIGSSNLYGCVYHEARVTYSATLISTP
jgi:hypothetical protein